MQQRKISFEDSQVKFLDNYKNYGYKDKSSLVREAVRRLEQEILNARIDESARLYEELYNEDPEIKELAEASLNDWPT